MSNETLQSNDGDSADDAAHTDPDSRPEEAPSADEIFELLKNNRRREILYYLEESDGSAAIKELARNIAAREHDVSTSAVTDKQYKRVYVALVQTHVPKLEEVGVIDFDEDDQTMSLQRKGQHLYSHLYLESGSRQPPLVDISETTEEILVRTDLPGFERDDIRIQASDGHLDIAAERPSPFEDSETVIQRERSTSIERSIPLPHGAVIEGADASYDQGVLEITLAKDDTTRVIEIG